MHKANRKYLLIIFALIFLPILALLSLASGRIHLSLIQVLQSLLGQNTNQITANIIFNLRLPRVLGALIIGACLGMAGNAFQNLFHNPLVSPDLLGVSYGASVGAAIAILLGMSTILIQFFALAGGLTAVFLALLISNLIPNKSSLILVLAGIIISGFMQAIIGLLKYIADPDSQLQTIVYWQLGSLAKIDLSSLTISLPLIVIGTIIILCLRWHLTVMSLGDIVSFTQGIDVNQERLIIIFAATLLTSSAVSLSGSIGWIGLVIPHIAKKIIGADARFALPLSAILGAELLLIIDTLARTISTGEIPLSILTGFIGAPIFAYILISKKVNWN